MEKVEIGNLCLYNKNGLYAKEKGKKGELLLADDIAKSFSVTSFHNIIYVVYEDIYGDIVKISIDGENITKDVLLYSKYKKQTNKSIFAYFQNRRLVTLFSTYYKDKAAIALFDEVRGLCIFDICDEFDFHSIQKKDEIIVVYKKSGLLGYSKILKDEYSSFKRIHTMNPLELFLFNSNIYLLAKEKDYVFIDIINNTKYNLPIVFGVRPQFYYDNNTIYLLYFNNKRKTIYRIENKKVVFHKEEL